MPLTVDQIVADLERIRDAELKLGEECGEDIPRAGHLACGLLAGKLAQTYKAGKTVTKGET
jgi:hypothetical protein